MPAVHINYVAVVVAALFSMAIGALWYSPLLFRKTWLKSLGKKLDDFGKPSPAYMLMLFGALLEAYVLAHFVSYAVAVNALDGARTGLWLAIGIVVPTFAGVALFEGKNWNWFLINVGYHLLTLMVMGALLAAWA